MNAVTLKNITKKYQTVTAVDNLSFGIEQGKITSLLGPNGAGKSTTISIICGLLSPGSGEVSVFGETMSKNSIPVRKRLGYVPQDIALYDDLSALENLRFWGKLYGLTGQPLQTRCTEVLRLTGLTDRQKDRVGKFSGGMKRRLNIGVALLHTPDLLIMDEPTVGIDPQSRRHILDSVKELNRKGMTILYTTHYMEEAQEISDTIAIMDRGSIIASGTHTELIKMVGQTDIIIIQTAGSPAEAVEVWKNTEGVESASYEEEKIRIYTGNTDALLPKLFAAAAANEIHVQSLEIQEPNLEAVFLHLTGRELRD